MATTLLVVALLAPTPTFAEPWSGVVVGQYPATSVRGDFNGDGLEDLAFGQPEFNGTRGQVALWFSTGDPRHAAVPHVDGSMSGFEAEWRANYVIIELTSPILQGKGLGNAAGSYLGSALVSGDFDRDGRADLAFGAPGVTVSGQGRAGAVVVLYGKDLGDPRATPPIAPSAGTAAVFHQDTAGVGSAAEPGDYLGEALAAGDFDCDRTADLAIGAPREDIGAAQDAGYVHVLYGAPGSGLTGVGSDTLFQGSAQLGESAEARDYFGASLAAGVFAPSSYLDQRWCSSLAVGAPGEDFVWGGLNRVDAGRVHLLRAVDYNGGGVFGGFQPLSAGSHTLLDQGVAGVLDSPEAYDHFGSALGRVPGSQIDDRWVVAGGEVRGGCPEGSVHRLPYGGADQLACAGVRLDAWEAERGFVVEHGDEYGRWLQYMSPGADARTAQIFVVVHGTNRFTSAEGSDYSGGRGNAHRFLSYGAFTDAAEWLNFIVIVPQLEDWSFGNEWPNNMAGGYRALMGRDIRADQWIERIADRYRASGYGDGNFHLFGHSAGGQFAIRYALERSARVKDVIVESSGSFPAPTMNGAQQAWPDGYAPMSLVGTDWGALEYTPNEANAVAAVRTRNILLTAGRDEDAQHTEVVAQWVHDTEQSWGVFTGTHYEHNVTYCEVLGVGHDSRNAVESSLMRMWPALSRHPDFQDAPGCALWLDKATP